MDKFLTFTLLLSSLVLFSCASTKKDAHPKGCIREEEISSLRKMMESTVETKVKSDGETLSPFSLVDDQCVKRVYASGDYRIVFKKGTLASDSEIRGNLSRFSDMKDKAACFKDAVELIHGLEIPFANIALQQHLKKFGQPYWDDPDFGPMKWLKCDGRPNPDFYSSLGTLLHEVNHELKDDQCLFIPSEGRSLCFKLDPKLPLRSLARIEKFPTKERSITQALEMVQKVYLTDMDLPPVMLFDELNSYIITNRAMTSVLKKKGAAALYDGESRQGVLLPLFLTYTVRYLSILRGTAPQLYQENFRPVPGNANYTNIQTLLVDSEKVYSEWLHSLRVAKKTPKPIEETLWNTYLAEKKLLWP